MSCLFCSFILSLSYSWLRVDAAAVVSSAADEADDVDLGTLHTFLLAATLGTKFVARTVIQRRAGVC